MSEITNFLKNSAHSSMVQSHLCTTCGNLFADIPRWQPKIIGNKNKRGDLAKTPDQVFRQWSSSYASLAAGILSGCSFCAEVQCMERDYEAMWFSRESQRVFQGPAGPDDDELRYGAKRDLLEGESLFHDGSINFRLEPVILDRSNPSDIAQLYLFMFNERASSEQEASWVGIGYFNVMAEPGDPAAHFISQQPLHLDLASNLNFARAREWIEECIQTHPECHGFVISKLPHRVIDVGSTKQLPRLCVDLQQEASYVALSYCWGGAQKFVATAQTLASLKRGFDPEVLPKTLQDAITVTRRLGQRYLWIDALCILQDQSTDKAIEISKMHEIYKNAIVTICASAPLRCEEGFLKDNTSMFPRSVVIPYIVTNGKRGSLVLRQELPFRREAAPLDTRGWAFQELYLAQRVLIYDSILWFRCKFEDWLPASCERLTGGKLNSLRGFDVLDIFDEPLVAEELKAEPGYLKRVNTQLEWSNIVRLYTSRNLTDPADKLPAVAGAASSLAATSRHHYLAGLWKETLIIDLLWYVSARFRHPRPAWRAPSWSWASVDGFVTIPRLFDQVVHDIHRNRQKKTMAGQPRGNRELVTHLEIIDCHTTPLFEQAQFGQVKSAMLKARGYMAPINHLERTAWIDRFDCSAIDGYLEVQFDSEDDVVCIPRPQNMTNGQPTQQSIDAIYSTQELWALLVIAFSSGRIGDGAQGMVVKLVSPGIYRRVGHFDANLDPSRPKDEVWKTWMSRSEKTEFSLI